MAQGDLITASQLTNPDAITFIPVGVKQWEWSLFVPIEAFLLRPERVDLAEKDCERIAQQLVQNGMQLVRDVQIAYTNLALATEQYQVGLEALKIRQDLANLTEKRLADGDIAELEAMQSRVDALNAKANAALLAQNISIAREQLALLMGIPDQADHLQVLLIPECGSVAQSADDLIAQAIDNRPDVQAAKWAVAAAAARCSLAKKAWWRIHAGADYNGNGEKGAQIGPGFRWDIPLFNVNEGGVARAAAELEAAQFNHDQIKDQIVQQIRIALRQIQQADENVTALRSEVLPTLAEALEIAQKGFEDGGTDYLLVLQTTSQYVDVKIRMLDQYAAICRAHAELNFSCGQSVR